MRSEGGHPSFLCSITESNLLLFWESIRLTFEQDIDPVYFLDGTFASFEKIYISIKVFTMRKLIQSLFKGMLEIDDIYDFAMVER